MTTSPTPTPPPTPPLTTRAQGTDSGIYRFARTTRRRALARDPLVGLVAILLASTLVFIGLWAYALYDIKRDYALLTLDIAAYRRDEAAADAAIRTELDTIYKTLYAPPDNPAATVQPPRQPSAVELWQRTRDKELRDRILRLEQWRLRQER